MFNTHSKITLISQILDSIDNHLQIIHLPMEQYQMSIENSDDELWLSGHRSIFSSYDSNCQKHSSVLRQSQYEDFHWDCYENQNYHRLAFEQDDQQQLASIGEWSMHLNSDSTEGTNSDNPRQTSWHEIKKKSLSQSSSLASTNNTSTSEQHTPNPLPLYRLFQQKISQQHPCYLYENFSDQSLCDSSMINSTEKTRKTLKSNVDQCLQTSLNKPVVTCLRSTDHLSSDPSQLSPSTTRYSLPNLDFLTFYAKENPVASSSSSTQTKRICTAMKSPLFDPLILSKKGLRTVFYCTVQSPLLSQPILSKRKTPPKEQEPVSSICSSISSSGYCSNSSRHIHTPLSPYPLKSCLKRTKETYPSDDISKHRRYSAPTSSPSSSQIKPKLCTLSEHDLRAKKSVSFCNEIARRLITPSTSPKTRSYDITDFLPRESFTESPPSEFNLSDDNEEEQTDEYEHHVINIIENVSDHMIKHENEKTLIDTCANTILRILEIKCSDPKSYYLNNQTNPELDRTLRQDLCFLLREILEDGLRQNTNSLFSKKLNLWRFIDLTTPTTGRLHEIKIKSQLGLPSTADFIDKFNAFIYQLLNFHELTTWFTNLVSQRTLLNTYYESSAFLLVNLNNDLLENLTNQLEKLSPLAFRLKYMINNSNQRSILSKKFQVRTWLRDKKPQVIKTSSKPSPTPPNVTIRRKFTTSIPINK